MSNYKIKVNNESESREAQELFFELGYEWNGSGKEVIKRRIGLIFTKEFHGKEIICYSCKGDEDIWSDYEGKELTIPQLRDLVVLHRNDVNDATHKYIGGGAAYKTVDDIAYLWTRMGWEYKGVAYDLVPLHKEPEQGLISGADALRALADGDYVEYWCEDLEQWVFMDMQNHFKRKFRLKPRTITLNVEIPAPFEPKESEVAWVLDSATPLGYKSIIHHVGCVHFACWRTEEEIKQVVAALRGVLK